MNKNIIDKEPDRKVKWLEDHYNEETGKYEITCKCGYLHELNRKQVLVINMHNLKCKNCGNPVLTYEDDKHVITNEEMIKKEFGEKSIKELKDYYNYYAKDDLDFEEWLDECMVYEKAMHIKKSKEDYSNIIELKKIEMEEINKILKEIDNTKHIMSTDNLIKVNNGELLEYFSDLGEQRVKINKLRKLHDKESSLFSNKIKIRDYLIMEKPNLEAYEKKLNKIAYPVSFVINEIFQARKDLINNLYTGRHEYLIRDLKSDEVSKHLKKSAIDELVDLCNKVNSIFEDESNYKDINWKSKSN